MVESIISEQADEEWVQLIQEAKRLGISPEQIRAFLEKDL